MMVHVSVDIDITAPAEDTDYHVVTWQDWFRVLNARGTVCAVCETHDEAQSWIDGQHRRHCHEHPD